MPTRRAFTLVEILVVCSILAIIMGMGAAFLGSLNRVMAVQAEKGRLDSLLRQAHNSATLEHAKAWVVLDPERNRIEVKAMTQVGTWHFEDEELTGFPPGQDVSLGNARLSDPSRDEKGKIGRCLVLSGGRSGVDFGTHHLFDSPGGIAIEAWVFPYREQNCTLFKKGKGLKLSLVGEYLEGTIIGVGTVDNSWGSKGSGRGGRRITLPVLVGRWSRIGISFDGSRLELRVNGAIAGVWPPPVKKKKKRKKGGGKPAEDPDRFRYKADKGASIVVGSRFHGMIDEVRISAVIHTEVYQLDPNVAIDPDRTTCLRIHFAPGGWLDEEAHLEPVRITLQSRSDPNRTEVLEIGRLGTIQ